MDRNGVRVVLPATTFVALRKESVDRNTAFLAARASSFASLSARRAWIEIVGGAIAAYPALRRSPQGERG